MWISKKGRTTLFDRDRVERVNWNEHSILIKKKLTYFFLCLTIVLLKHLLVYCLHFTTRLIQLNFTAWGIYRDIDYTNKSNKNFFKFIVF